MRANTKGRFDTQPRILFSIIYAFCSLNRSSTGAAEFALSDVTDAAGAATDPSTLPFAADAFSPCKNFLESSSGRPSEAL